MESHRQIEDTAAAFLARRDSGEWTEGDAEFLAQWIAESVAHRVAFLRLEAVWEEARRLKALSAGLQRGTVPPPGEWQHSPFFGRSPAREQVGAAFPSGKGGTRRHGSRWRVAAAACFLLVVGAGAYFSFGPHDDRYTTPIGGLATVPLRDGSNITLNTASSVRIELTAKERHIRLDEGEAFFEVAKDPNRPFVVQVGDKRVIAVGTKFSVRRDGVDIRVAVTEGKVRVLDTTTPLHVRRDAGAPPSTLEQGRHDALMGEVFLTPGSIASTGDSGVVVLKRSLAEVEDGLAWRQGYLTFHATKLADVVAEFNRYNIHKITIAEPDLAEIRISGTFRTINYQAFVRVLHEGFSIQVQQDDDTTTLTRD